MGSFSLIHWIILGVIILLLFGGNRFSAMMSDVAKGLKSFKQGLSEDDKPSEQPPEQRTLPRNADRPIDVSPEPRRTADPVTPGDDRTTN
ncbi:MAG TPA: twin-arginine translocase TatA/TatE family subunit [Sphingomicrobium sp.]|nr:twin-arginine translocase TatA/TatE family subunit [Sphingomicrobium sp.]